MATLLDLPEVRQRVARWSVEEYERFTELGAFRKNVELVRGIIVEKMSKSPLHRHIALKLYDLLLAMLPQGWCVLHESPLRLKDSEPEPDVCVVQGAKEDYRHRHPATAALVIEVAVTSVELDRQSADLYAEAGVDEYWIVMPKQSAVEVHRKPVHGSYSEKSIIKAPAVLPCGSLAEVGVDLNMLFSD